MTDNLKRHVEKESGQNLRSSPGHLERKSGWSHAASGPQAKQPDCRREERAEECQRAPGQQTYDQFFSDLVCHLMRRLPNWSGRSLY